MPRQSASLRPDAHFVIVRFSSLGDVVKGTHLPRLIKSRYPQARVTWVTAEAFAELLRDNPHLDQVIGFERRHGLAGLRALARRLRAEGVDVVADVHKSLRSRLLRRLLRAPGVPYSKRTWQRFWLIRFRLNTYRPPRGKEQDFAAALAPFDIADDGLGTELFVQRLADDPAFADRLGDVTARLQQWRTQGRPVLGVAPVAAWALKRWPMEHFRALLHAYVQQMRGAVLVFGGPGDTDAAALAQGLGDDAMSLVGRTSHRESAYFAGQCDLVVTNDTGMLHLAEAVGTDVVALFGPTTRELGYFPIRPGSEVVERPLPCRPCTRMGEGRCTHPLPKACLVTISPEHVLARVRAHLTADGPNASTQEGAPC